MCTECQGWTKIGVACNSRFSACSFWITWLQSWEWSYFKSATVTGPLLFDTQYWDTLGAWSMVITARVASAQQKHLRWKNMEKNRNMSRLDRLVKKSATPLENQKTAPNYWQSGLFLLSKLFFQLNLLQLQLVGISSLREEATGSLLFVAKALPASHSWHSLSAGLFLPPVVVTAHHEEVGDTHLQKARNLERWLLDVFENAMLQVAAMKLQLLTRWNF